MTTFAQQALNGLLLGGMFALMALGLTVMFGVMHIVNFAYGTLYMAGAYVAYAFSSRLGLPFFAALTTAFAVLVLIGIVVESVAFRPLRMSEERTLLLGLGLLLLGRGAIIAAFGSQNHSLGIPLAGRVTIGSVVVSQQRVLTFAVSLGLFVLVWLAVSRTRAGRVMRAVAANPERAELLGVNRRLAYGLTFGVSTGIAAVAACLLSTSFSVTPTIDDQALLISFTIVILGGLGSIPGALVGGMLVGLLNTLGTQYLSQTFAPAYPYLLLLVVLLLRPQGIFGRRSRLA